jgi:hypothetical protein
MESKAKWKIEVIAPGDPCTVLLGIDYGDGTYATPVEVKVPQSVLEQGDDYVAGYFLNACRGRYELRRALEMDYNIDFE